MSFNSKSKPNAKESPTEPFKRAVTGCLRAIARKAEREVANATSSSAFLAMARRHPVTARLNGSVGDSLALGFDLLLKDIAICSRPLAPSPRKRGETSAQCHIQ